jgi:hypothetical protein
MTPFGAVRACGSASAVCGTRDGYYATDLVVGENMGVTGDILVKGDLAEVTNVSILRALSVNGMANFDGDVTVGGRLQAHDADVNKGSLFAGTANVRGNLHAPRLDVGGNARVLGSVEVSRDISATDGVFAQSGVGYFGTDLGAGGSIVAMGDVKVGGNHIAARNVIVGGDIVSGQRLGSGGDAVFGGSVAANDVEVKGALGVKKGVALRGALDVGQSVAVGGNILAEGANGLSVTNGAVRVGVLPPGADGGALVPGVHVERGHGRRTSFPRSGDSLVDGTLKIGSKMCVGAECLTDKTIAAFKGRPAVFNGRIREAVLVVTKKRVDLAASVANRFRGFAGRMNEMSVGVRANEVSLAAARSADAEMLLSMGQAEITLKKQDDTIVWIDNRNDLQDARLDALEKRLKAHDGRMLGAVQTAMASEQSRLTICENKPPPPPPKPWKLTVWQDMAFTGNVVEYDASSMTEYKPGVYITNTPFGVSSWDLQKGDAIYADLYFSEAKTWSNWKTGGKYWKAEPKGTRADFEVNFIIVEARNSEPEKPFCTS